MLCIQRGTNHEKKNTKLHQIRTLLYAQETENGAPIIPVKYFVTKKQTHDYCYRMNLPFIETPVILRKIAILLSHYYIIFMNMIVIRISSIQFRFIGLLVDL